MLTLQRFLWPSIAALFTVFIAWIIFCADTGRPTVFITLVRGTPYGDKMAHFLLYGVLSFVINLALKNRRTEALGYRWLIGSLLVFTFAILEEFTQMLLPSRNFELWDMICDTLGIALFSVLALKFDRNNNGKTR